MTTVDAETLNRSAVIPFGATQEAGPVAKVCNEAVRFNIAKHGRETLPAHRRVVMLTKPDWESIERDYRAGQLSIREIGRVHEISDKAIRNKAKNCGWQRDLTDKVNERVRSELVRSEVRAANAQDKQAKLLIEREIVDAAAGTVVQVVREHRRDIASVRGIVALLTQQLMDVAGQRDAFEAGIEDECQKDKTGERRNKLMKAVSLSSHAATVRDLSQAMRHLVGLERQAFGIVDNTDTELPLPVTTTINIELTHGFQQLRQAFDARLNRDKPAMIDITPDGE